MKAFPNPKIYVSSEGQIIGLASQMEGMDLRDYFAAKAMQAIIGKADDRSTTVDEVELWIGHYAYTVADAMMEARK
jgi:hypothetical protein